MRIGVEAGINLQHITTDDAAGRVHQHMVADAWAFRVQALQHTQRAAVAVQRNGAFTVAGVVQGKVAMPACGCRRHEAFMSLANPGAPRR